MIPFGPFHPTLDEPAHFRLYVEGEMVRGCEYRGFMVHRGIEKLAESVLGYNDIPMLAERICGICGCVHSVAYVQAVESAAALRPPPRAEYIRTIMLEIERLHSHLLWMGLACHIVGFDTLFMQSFRIREPIMWIAEKITRQPQDLCALRRRGACAGTSRPTCGRAAPGARQARNRVAAVVAAVSKDRNIQKRTVGVGVADQRLVKSAGLVGPVARAAGVAIDCRRDHPVRRLRPGRFRGDHRAEARDVWSRLVVRMAGGVRVHQDHPPVPGQDGGRPTATGNQRRIAGRDGSGLSSVEAPRGESHHFVITGENNRPRRWRVRAPTYQNLPGRAGDDQGPADRRHDHFAGQH